MRIFHHKYLFCKRIWEPAVTAPNWFSATVMNSDLWLSYDDEGNMRQSRGFLIQSTLLIPRIVLTAEWLKECWQCSWGGLPPSLPQLWTMAVETNQSVTRKQRDLRAQFKRRNIREGCRNLIFPTCNTWGHDTWYIYACSRNGRK